MTSNATLSSAMLLCAIWLTAGVSPAVAQSPLPLTPGATSGVGGAGMGPGGAPGTQPGGAPRDMPGADNATNPDKPATPRGRSPSDRAPAATRPKSEQDAPGPGGMGYGRDAEGPGGMSRGRGGMTQDSGGMGHGGAQPDAGGNNLPSYQYPGANRRPPNRGLPGPGGSRSW